MANEEYIFPKKLYIVHEAEDADDPDDEGYLLTFEDKDDLAGRDDDIIVAEYELKRQGEVSIRVHIKFDKE